MATADDEEAPNRRDGRVPPGDGSLDETARSDAGGGSATTVGARDAPARDATLPAEIGRYQILSKLGEGGMGLVLLGADPLLQRRVAIKILHVDGGAHHEAAQQRLLREAQGMARLSHENVIVVHEVGTHRDQVYLAMEYVEGGTLTRWQADRGWREIIDRYVRAGRGLQAAHDLGLVHRDFKPDNVLVGDDGRVRVTDFGLVATADAPQPEVSPTPVAGVGAPLGTKLTATGAIMGTPRYMAPEQHLGEVVDARADQFAFCVALYEALYGEPPFAGRDYAELVRHVLAGEVGAVPADSSVPREIRAALLRGLSRARTDRHVSMGELLALLSPPAPSAPSPRRWPIALGAGVVAIAGTIAIALVLRLPGPSIPAPAPAPVVEGATSSLDVAGLKPGVAAFDQAHVAFRAGKFAEAARGFEAAHAVLPVPQMLYNRGASLYLQGKRDGDVGAYAAAVDAYTRYLAIDPMAPGVADAVDVIKREVARIERAHPGSSGPTHVEPSAEIQQLAVPEVRGVTVLTSQPPGATIYIDDQSRGPFGVTPWAGTLAGRHELLIAKRGYRLLRKAVTFDPTQLLVLDVWLEPESATPPGP